MHTAISPIDETAPLRALLPIIYRVYNFTYEAFISSFLKEIERSVKYKCSEEVLFQKLCQQTTSLLTFHRRSIQDKWYVQEAGTREISAAASHQ